MKLFKPTFQWMEQMKRSRLYVMCVLCYAMRKNVEQMALGLRKNVRNRQYFVGQSQWDTEPGIEIHQGLISATLGESEECPNIMAQ